MEEMLKPCQSCGTVIEATGNTKRCASCAIAAEIAKRTSPDFMPPEVRPAALALIDQRSIPVPHAGCWIWTEYTGRSGYGRISYDRWRGFGAHRFSFLAHHGEIPSGLYVCHHCDVPECVNPEHLYAGTPEQNAQDSIRRGRRAHLAKAA